MRISSYVKQAAVITTADELASAIEAAIKKSFPKSTVKVATQNSLGPGKVIFISFAVAGSKAEVVNGIWENDISITKAYVYGVKDDGTLGNLSFEPTGLGGSVITKSEDRYHAFSSVKVGLRKKKGTPEQIVKHVENYFKKLLATIKANADKIPEDLKELLKSISL